MATIVPTILCGGSGSRLWPGFAGLVLTEAVKESFAIKARPARARAVVARPHACALWCRHDFVACDKHVTR